MQKEDYDWYNNNQINKYEKILASTQTYQLPPDVQDPDCHSES